MCKVMMIYPYFLTNNRTNQIFHPLGISMISSGLKDKGIEVMKLDCTFLTMEEALEIARDYNADITSIYVMTTMSQNALKLLEELRKINPKSLYITGGPLPSLYPERFAQKFDFVFAGEGALSVPKFCYDYFEFMEKDALNKSMDKSAVVSKFFKGRDCSDYSGIYGYISGRDDFNLAGNSLISAHSVNLSEAEINALPLVDRSGFNHQRYQELSFENTGQKSATIMMTYGCPFDCDFCSKPVFGNKVRFREMDSIFREIRDIKNYGYDTLWIADDLFTLKDEYIATFCDRMNESNLKMKWSCLSRVDSISPETARKMKLAGCEKVYLGIESGSDAVLKLMNKHINIGKVKAGVDVFKNEGIECAGFFIVGYPGETVETIETTFEFALSLGLDEISFNVPYPLPGSKLYSRVLDIKDDDWNFENETKFLYKSEFDQTWIRKRIEETLEKHSLNNMQL
ncbi:MAG: radical SAM protein [Proteocatella sp.]